MPHRQSIPIDVALRREVAARHRLDVRTLDRALRDGIGAVRAGLVASRVADALAELVALAAERRAPRSW